MYVSLIDNYNFVTFVLSARFNMQWKGVGGNPELVLTLEAPKYSSVNQEIEDFFQFEIIISVLVSYVLVPLHLNTYVMCLRPI